MTRPCDVNQSGRPVGSKILAQTLFLGASVVSYSANMGWGGQASTLTVELINDFQPASCLTPNGQPIPVFKPGTYPDNHYYTCVGDACYVDENGDPYNSNRQPPPIQKKIPGKVYYAWTPQGLVSRYWFYEDPGFFGESTKIGLDGQLMTDEYTSYDIIGIPVYFVMDGFVFGGMVQSWEKNNRQGQITYTVTIESMDNVLDSSWIILKDYGGSVFTKLQGQNHPFGAPINYVELDQAVTSIGSIAEGALPNVFNVYGFLESCGISYFGGSYSTEDGIPYTDVVNALAVLTSCVPRNQDDAGQLNDLNKRAFSPFGRILTKTIQENGSLLRPSAEMGFGTISPKLDAKGIHRTSFALDLSELPAPPADFKIAGDVITIMDFIRSLTSQMGKDFYTTLIPCIANNEPYNIIKIKVIDRNTQPSQNQIPATLNTLQAQGYSVSIDSLGKEWNQSANPRVMYIGGKQERIYQAKNYRLGFRQTAYIYDPAIDKLVDFNIAGAGAGKIKVPSAYSTRNPFINLSRIGADLNALWDTSEEIHRRKNNINFESNDSVWQDTEVGGSDSSRTGNYLKAKKIQSGFAAGADANGNVNRYVPIYMDTICPFFGYVLEDKIDLASGEGSNNFRKIRPVWLDSWTGQLVIVCTVDELPPLTIGTSSLYRTSQLQAFNGKFFLITETEMRAAMVGFDEYFTYCNSKSVGTKPHAFLMLMAAYYYANPSLANFGGWVQTGVVNGVPWLPPGGISAVLDNNGRRVGFEYLFDNNFIKDLMAIHAFIGSIGQKYYGQKYMVRLPEIRAYQDRTYADLQIPPLTYVGELSGTSNLQAYQGLYNNASEGSIGVFQGSGKIYFNVEPCDSGWEEPGNAIDDSFIVGSEAWYALINEQSKIPPLLGYNASDSYDYEARRQCGLSVIANSNVLTVNDQRLALLRDLGVAELNRRIETLPASERAVWASWFNTIGSIRPDLQNKVLRIDTNHANYIRWFLSAQGVCDDSKFIFPSLSLGSLSKDDFVLMNTRSPRQDAYGRTISAGEPPPSWRPPILTPDLRLQPISNPGGMAKKLFVKANQEGIGFMDPVNLTDPRVIVSSQKIDLNPPSLSFAIDPTRTVMANAALEDLIVYIKMTTGFTIPYNQNHVDYLLGLIRGYTFFLDTKMDPDTGEIQLPSFMGNAFNKGVWWPDGGYNLNVSNQHATIAPKAAHPYFAAVPVRYNQFSYGPWTNYPSLIANDLLLPGIRNG